MQDKRLPVPKANQAPMGKGGPASGRRPRVDLVRGPDMEDQQTATIGITIDVINDFANDARVLRFCARTSDGVPYFFAAKVPNRVTLPRAVEQIINQAWDDAEKYFREDVKLPPGVTWL